MTTIAKATENVKRRHALNLTRSDLIDLEGSGLTDQTIKANGLYSSDEADHIAKILHIGPGCSACKGALIFSYHSLDGEPSGFARVKPHHPRVRDGRPVKYEQPTGESPRAYFPVGSIDLINDGKSAIYITEGEKKALALSQLGLAAIGIGGVWSWKTKTSNDLIDDLDEIRWTGRKVYLVFDYDPDSKTRATVNLAAERLGEAIRKKGATSIYTVALPGKGKKVGIDDFLVAAGSKAKDTFADLVDSATPVKRVVFSNYRTIKIKNEKGAEEEIKVGITPKEIRQKLIGIVGNWPKRVGSTLFVEQDGQSMFIESETQLFAWIGSQITSPVRWAGGEDKVSGGVFHAYLTQCASEYESVEVLPHEPPFPKSYYLHPELEGGDGVAIKGLIDRFSHLSIVDRALLLSAFMTPITGIRPGARPAFLMMGEENETEGGRGIGKTTLVKTIGHLFGGHIDIRPNDSSDRIMARLLTPTAFTKRICLIDNLKTLKFSWSELEALITNDTISGHRLYAGDASRPNLLTWFITLNNADLSKDMAKRCVVIKVRRPEYSAEWDEEIQKYIDDNRQAIMGDLVALLKKDKPALTICSRWASWERDVLAISCNQVRDWYEADIDIEDVQREIKKRQDACDGDQQETDDLRSAFTAAIRMNNLKPDNAVVFITNKMVAEIVNDATGEKKATNKASAYLQTLAIPEMRKTAIRGVRGWKWTGKNAPAGCTAVQLRSQVDLIANDLKNKSKG